MCSFLKVSVEIIVVTKIFHDISIGSNYLQNESGVAELDDALEKAAEVMKRLLHTQKVSTAALRCTWFPICV
jgi:DNA primase large subunit